MAPDNTWVRQRLLRPDLFTVVHEIFSTDTCDCADIVLPVTAQLEQLDIHRPYGTLCTVWDGATIAPLGDAALAARNPLVLLALALRHSLNASFLARTPLRRDAGEPTLDIQPAVVVAPSIWWQRLSANRANRANRENAKAVTCGALTDSRQPLSVSLTESIAAACCFGRSAHRRR